MRQGALVRVCMVGAALSLAVGGIAPRARAAQPHRSTVTISIWTAYTSSVLRAFNTLTSRFERKYPYIKVDVSSSPNYNALLQKEQSAVFAGNTPTIGQAYEEWVRQFAKSNAVQNLDPYIHGKQGLSATEIKDFFDKDWKDGLLGTTRYMMPFSKSDIVLYFDGPMLRRYGIKAPPTTWSQFAADCKKVTVNHGGTPSQWCMTFQIDSSSWYVWEAEWGSPILKNGRAAFGTRKGAAPVEFFANLARHKEMVVAQSANYQDQADFDAGKTAFDISSSAGLTYYISGAKPGVGVGVAPFPAGPVHQYTELYGAPFVMFKSASSDQKQAAWLYLKFLTEPQQTAYWAINTGYMPVRKSALKLKVMRDYYRHNPQEQASVRQLPNAILEPPVLGWAKARNDIGTDLQAALNGTQSPMSAMQHAAQQVNSDLQQ